MRGISFCQVPGVHYAGRRGGEVFQIPAFIVASMAQILNIQISRFMSMLFIIVLAMNLRQVPVPKQDPE